jgi:hypothetical protein
MSYATRSGWQIQSNFFLSGYAHAESFNIQVTADPAFYANTPEVRSFFQYDVAYLGCRLR